MLDQFRDYQSQLREYFATDEEFEEEFEEDEGPVGTAVAIEALAKTLESVEARIEWLEGLRADPAERARLSEITGIELTQEALDAIIEGARAEAQFIEQQIRQLQEGIQAMVEPVFMAEARDYNHIMNVDYGTSILELDAFKLAANESWY